MFVQFNFGDPSVMVRDAIGDWLQETVTGSLLLSAEVVGRLTGWGSWVDEETGQKYVEQSGSLQIVCDIHPVRQLAIKSIIEQFAAEAASKFEQDAVAVLYG